MNSSTLRGAVKGVEFWYRAAVLSLLAWNAFALHRVGDDAEDASGSAYEAAMNSESARSDANSAAEHAEEAARAAEAARMACKYRE